MKDIFLFFFFFKEFFLQFIFFTLLGECTLNKGRGYGILAKLAYLTRYSKAFRTSFLQQMEGWKEDFHEQLHCSIEECYKKTTAADNTVSYTPITSQGTIAQELIEKKEQNYLLQLCSPFQSIDCLLPNLLDVGVEIEFSSASKFFTCSKAGVKPKFHIKGYTLDYRFGIFRSFRFHMIIISFFFTEAKLYVLACLLTPEANLKVQQRLTNGTIQIPFMGNVIKSYSIEVGHLQGEINISLKVYIFSL